jgi:hypothetical protein
MFYKKQDFYWGAVGRWKQNRSFNKKYWCSDKKYSILVEVYSKLEGKGWF